MSTTARVGVLALQGDFEAHVRVVSSFAPAALVRTAADLGAVDALIVPGGESTTIGLLLDEHDLVDPIRKRVADGMPMLGTCAGMIVCARRVLDPALVRGKEQVVLGVADVSVRRNAYGRQVDSFETSLAVRGVSDGPMHAVFIRAPLIEEAGPQVQVLAEYDGRPVAVRDGNVVLTAFHPEISGDDRLHRMLVEDI